MIRSRFIQTCSRFVVLPLIFSMVLATSYVPTALTPRAEAGSGFGGIVYDPTNWIQNAISAAASKFIGSLTDLLVIKDYTLDGIAFAIINMMIQQMSQDIVRWINSGFQGDPAFVRDFDRFLTGVVDRAVGEFIGGTELGAYLCSPFRIQVQYALEIQYTATRNFGAPANACTLSGIEKNIEDFLAGNTVIGSWDDWFRITQNPQYNTHGAMLAAQEKLMQNIGNSKSQQEQMLAWGDGFLSSQECVENDINGNCVNYAVTTPGTTIENALNDALGAPGRRLEVADEINEIFAALFNQLVVQAFNGVGGLLGLTDKPGVPASNPYYASLYTQPSGSQKTELGSLIANAITTETQYRTLNEQMLTMLTNASNYKDVTYPNNSCHPGTLSPELQDQFTQISANVVSANLALTKLGQIQNAFFAAGSNPDLIRAVSQDFVNLQSSGELHTTADNRSIQTLGMPLLQNAINSFTAGIDSVCP